MIRWFCDPMGDLPPVPRLPGIGEAVPNLAQTRLFPVGIDHAVVGLVDPAHVPFVHKSAWYRPAGCMHEMSKRFVPIDLGLRMVHHVIYWIKPWLSLVKPIARLMAHTFLEQDRRIVADQWRGLQYDSQLMMIHDAETLARWYYELKGEFTAFRREERPFRNPVSEKVLRWQT